MRIKMYAMCIYAHTYMCVVRGRGYWDLGVKYALLYDYVVCNYMQKVNNMTNFYVLGWQRYLYLGVDTRKSGVFLRCSTYYMKLEEKSNFLWFWAFLRYNWHVISWTFKMYEVLT